MTPSDLDAIDRFISSGRAIQYCDETPDNQYPEITWQILGLVDTNEIAVLARCGDLRISRRRASGLMHPAMADRIFGIDVADQALAMELTDEIWAMYEKDLVAAVESVRTKGK